MYVTAQSWAANMLGKWMIFFFPWSSKHRQIRSGKCNHCVTYMQEEIYNIYGWQLGNYSIFIHSVCELKYWAPLWFQNSSTDIMCRMRSVKRRKGGLPGNWGTLWVGWRTRPWRRNQIWGGASSQFALSLSPGERRKRTGSYKKHEIINLFFCHADFVALWMTMSICWVVNTSPTLVHVSTSIR